MIEMKVGRIILIICMLILVFYTIFTALHDYKRMNNYCTSVCESFGESLQGVQGSYCVCENTYLLAYDIEEYNKRVNSQ